jgi:Toprim-like/Protein of unknown function (DUF3991)
MLTRAKKPGRRKRKAMFDPELESFKRIPLHDYATSLGYAIDRRKSSRGSLVMRHKNGDKIIISLKPDGHYTYWSPRDDKDNGTILDFLSRRTGKNLGQIRITLREWTGTGTPARPALPQLQSTPKDRAAVEARYNSMRVAHHHPYLEQERRIPALALQYWRFDGKVKTDSHSNAAFVHVDRDGICGFELRNTNFKGFASGGTKGLFLSKTIPEDKRLVIAESAIDVISYAVLFPDGHTRYASIGGKPSPAQVELLKVEIKRMPEESEIVAAMDNDEAGRQLVAVVAKAFDEVRWGKQTFRAHMPVGVKDWNQALQAAKRPSPGSSNPLEARPA